MRNAYFREHGMFIDSGTVEATCKAVIGQRLKLSGMRWNIPGARHPHPSMQTSQQPLRAQVDTADSGHCGLRIDCGAGHHAVLCLTTDEWLSGMGLWSLPAG